MEKLLFVPDKYLRKKAEKVDKVGYEELKIANKMKEIMLKAPGVGLAANQIGVLKQIVTIFYVDQDTKKEKNYFLFNPEIISYSNERVYMEEGCLSLPNQFAEIERPKSIKIQYLNEKNIVIKKDITGIEARILQHEIDHLSGKLFIDYLSKLKKSIILKKVKKFLKNQN
tara:strand:- start:6465 stop:6974 length:510 start_codon:yes stop_codon:yes gene_type:complete